MCAGCIGERYKICKGLDELHPHLLMCKKCEKIRTHQGTGSKTHNEKWAFVDAESPELMALCLKQGLEHTLTKDKLTLVDSRFEWTEPHSRRVRVRVTVQCDIPELPNGGSTLQASSTVEFRVNTRQCPDCAAENSTGGGEAWRAVVQLRQRATHKKTLLDLELKARKQGVVKGCMGVEQMRDGLDFYFEEPSKAALLVEWMRTMVPVRTKTSKKLISQDRNSNLDHIKYSTMVEMVPLCRDDLVS